MNFEDLLEEYYEIIKKEKRDNEMFYYLKSLEKIDDLKAIINFIEKDGYVINEIKINFIHDDSNFIAPKIYNTSSNMFNVSISISFLS